MPQLNQQNIILCSSSIDPLRYGTGTVPTLKGSQKKCKVTVVGRYRYCTGTGRLQKYRSGTFGCSCYCIGGTYLATYGTGTLDAVLQRYLGQVPVRQYLLLYRGTLGAVEQRYRYLGCCGIEVLEDLIRCLSVNAATLVANSVEDTVTHQLSVSLSSFIPPKKTNQFLFKEDFIKKRGTGPGISTGTVTMQGTYIPTVPISLERICVNMVGKQVFGRLQPLRY